MKLELKGNARMAVALGLVAPALFSIPSRSVVAQVSNPLLVVINPRNLAGAALNRAEVKNILLGNKTSWPNGEQIPVIFGPPGDSDRAVVLKEIAGMNEAVFTRRQLQASFAGGAPVMVTEVKSGAEVKAALRTSPLAVGFMHKSQVDDSVRVVFALE
jgi:ABC-type phosphate transport system substrate-binding protein